MSKIACLPPASAPLTSPFSIEAKGSFFFHSGCWGASSLTQSIAKKKKEIHRLFCPQRNIVVEYGDTFSGCYKVGRPFLYYRRHEYDNRLLGFSIVPGWKRINGLSCRQTRKYQDKTQYICWVVFVSLSLSLYSSILRDEGLANQPVELLVFILFITRNTLTILVFLNNKKRLYL